MSEQRKKKLNQKYFLSTYISSLVSRLPTLPLERLIILQQTGEITKFQNKKGHTSNFRYLRNISKKEGFLSIFKGNFFFFMLSHPQLRSGLLFVQLIQPVFAKTDFFGEKIV